MKLSEIIKTLEEWAPKSLQENYDNSGLLIGDTNSVINSALVCLDVTEATVDEALEKKCDLIISHHPLIFKGLKQITGGHFVERIVKKAIKQDISIYAIHTNLDNTWDGVNYALCEKLGIINYKILSPQKGILKKLVTFCPSEHADKVRAAMFNSGAGNIGEYDSCSFNLTGKGSFRAGEDSNPFVGEVGKLHYEEEVRIETVFPASQQGKVLQYMLEAHPYEEVAYDIYPIDNVYEKAGAGMIGELDKGISEKDFLLMVKEKVGANCIRHSAYTGREVKKVAVCGGSGSFLIKDAINANADVFITGDVKYHDFFEADGKLVIADIGHYESEQFAMDQIHSYVKKNFPNFALLISETNTNSVNYL